MIIDFSKIDFKEKPVLLLKNLDGTVIQTLGYAFNVCGEFSYNEISTLTFDLPAKVNGELTPHYDDVVGMKIVDLLGIGQFILINPSENSDGIRTVKSCRGYSIEYEFAKKEITLENGTYNFWNPVDKDDTIIGRILEKMPDWSIGNIDRDLIGKYRTFETVNKKIYNFMKSDVQESYGCIFEFDTYKRKINAVSVNSEVETTPVYLSQERLIKEIDIEEESDSIITCLDVCGEEGVNIRGVNPTGTNKIYNLDYFMNTSNFSEELIQKWELWKRACENMQDAYYTSSVDLKLQTSRELAEQAKLTDLKNELTNLKNKQAVIIEGIAQNLETDDALTKVNKEIREQENKVSNQEKILSDTKNIAASLNETLKGFNKDLAMDRQNTDGSYVYFTPDELKELQRYFIEDSFQDSSFATSETTTYDNTNISSHFSSSSLSIKNCSIKDVVSGSSKIIKDITAAESGETECTLQIGALSAKIIRGTVEFGEDKSFIFTAQLGNGRSGTENFTAGNVTVTGGGYGLLKSDDSNLSCTVTDGTVYFTKNKTEYEKHLVEYDLYEYGKQVLREKAFPSYTFSVESGNFLAAEEFAAFKNNLSLGKRVYLKLDNREILEPYIVTARIEYEDASSFSLEFSDTYTTFDKQFALSKLLEQSVSLGKTLNLKSGAYGEFVSSGASTAVKTFMDSALDIAKNTVMSSGKQAIEIGDSGIQIKKWADENRTAYAPEQAWIVDNMIAFTEDNWDTSCMAVGKIFDENFGEYEPASKTYDPSKVYFYRTGNSAPYKYKPYTYDSSTWNTEHDKLWCKNGGVKYGVAAPYLVGTLLAGKNLFIDTDDGYFKVDDNGVLVQNEKFVISSTDGNGLTFDADEGLVHKVNANGKKYEAGFSATNSDGEGYGLYFKVGDDKKLYFDIDTSKLVVDGDIYAKNMFLGSNKKNVLEYCGNSDGGTNNDNDKKWKIKGDYIEGRGLRAYDDRGDVRVEINGDDGSMLIYNGDIKMQTGGDKLEINPTDFIKWTIDNEAKFYYDLMTNSLVFKGDIRSSDIYGSKFYNENGTSYLVVGAGASNWGDLTICNNRGDERFQVYDRGTNIALRLGKTEFLYSSGSNTYMVGNWLYNGEEVATQDDISNLQSQINALKNNNPII